MTSALVMAWQLPGCGPACRPRQHDPLAHERWGRLTGRLAAPGGVVSVEALTVDFDTERVTVAGEDVRITPTEWGILAVLVANRGRVVRHSEVIAAAWGAEYLEPVYTVSHHMLRTNVARLRKKLGAAGALIVTVVGRGLWLGASPPPTMAPAPALPKPWATAWDRCEFCRTTDRAHMARGLCVNCYKRQRQAGKFL